MREKHEAFNLHAIHVEKDPGKSKSYRWTCKYCGKQYISGSTRLLHHLTKVGGQVAACKEVPQSVVDDLLAKARHGATTPRASTVDDEIFPPVDAPSHSVSGSASAPAPGSASTSA